MVGSRRASFQRCASPGAPTEMPRSAESSERKLQFFRLRSSGAREASSTTSPKPGRVRSSAGTCRRTHPCAIGNFTQLRSASNRPIGTLHSTPLPAHRRTPGPRGLDLLGLRTKNVVEPTGEVDRDGPAVSVDESRVGIALCGFQAGSRRGMAPRQAEPSAGQIVWG